MGRFLAELGSTDIDVLDFGCGWGGETIWIAKHVRAVAGVDVDEESIDIAKSSLQGQFVRNCRFVHSPDGSLPFPSSSFDTVFSTNTFEHVLNLDVAFDELFRVLRPGGALLTRFGPLFYSPFGYHLSWACAVPYAHLLFGLPAVLALREARSGSCYSPATWQETGLNGKRYHEYRASATRAGFECRRFEALPVRNLRPLTWIPRVGDLFIFGIDAHLRKPS
jgi:SAM-dependent methyltransferase